MARMPGAVWKPMVGSSTMRMSAYDVLCLHTCVGSLAGTDSWFRKLQDGTNSHFGVGGDGTIWQWVDTAYRSGASYNGNYHLISVESADMGAPFGPWAGSDVPAFTAAQIDALGRIARWVHETHGIPLTQIPDARPGRRGVGYHRLGVPGYMVAGAERWSTKNGKVCPGDRRIGQVPQVIAAAQGEDMALTDDDIVKLWYGPRFRDNMNYAQVIQQMQDAINAVARQTQALDLSGRPGGASDDQYGHILSVRAEVEALSAKVDALGKGGAPAAAPAVNVDAAGVAAALGKDDAFQAALAGKLADLLAQRLQS